MLCAFILRVSRSQQELPALKLDVYASQFRKALAGLKTKLEKEKYRARTTTADANSAALLDALRTQATINFMQK